MREVRWGAEDHIFTWLKEPAYANRRANREEEKRNRDERFERDKRCQRVGGLKKKTTWSHHVPAAYGNERKRRLGG